MTADLNLLNEIFLVPELTGEELHIHIWCKVCNPVVIPFESKAPCGCLLTGRRSGDVAAIDCPECRDLMRIGQAFICHLGSS